MNQARSQLLAAILELARELPPTTFDALVAELETNNSGANWTALGRLGSTQIVKERIGELIDLIAISPDLDGRALAFALQASAHATAKLALEQSLEVAWTGPATDAVPLRRVDQVLYELVESAKSEILLVTYAAYKAAHALDALRAAAERGVRVTLVIELAHQSGGKITFDGHDSIRAKVPRANIFYWPLERRARNSVGAYGSMHVKCVVADRNAALVSSANLTDHALEMNMELGLLVRGVLPGRLAAHFDQLVFRGELVAAHGSGV